MTTYKLGKPMVAGGSPSSVIKDGLLAIPMDESNTDYQE